jgi:hypothetical protein
MKVTHEVTVPVNTCHPGANVEYRSQAKPFPTWNCVQCGKVISVDKKPPKVSAN